MYFVYLLLCKDQSVYTGITNDLKQRLSDHRNGKGGRYTRSHGALKFIYTEKHPTKSSALSRERQIKGWSKKKKLKLSTN